MRRSPTAVAGLADCLPVAVESAWAYCGLRLAGDLALVELPLITKDEPTSLLLTTFDICDCARSWVHHWTVGSEVFLSLGTLAGTHVLRFGNGALFTYDRRDRTVKCPPTLDASARHQLLDHVLPRVLDDLGHLMIHGSAINTASGSVVFIGDSGLGKSTLAASFQMAGSEFLSDDCMRLNVDAHGGVACTSTYRSLRLWPDSADAVMPTSPVEPMSADNEKLRVNLPEAPLGDDSKVAAICVLVEPKQDADAVTVSAVEPVRAVALLLAQCFRLDPTDAGATRRAFERCADVVERIPVVELSYQRDYHRLSEVHEAVLQRAKIGDWTTVTAT